MLFTRADLDRAALLVHARMAPTPAYAWPLLAQRFGVNVIVKHENHTPTGAFKIRGGIAYVDALLKSEPKVSGLISATRGNHGQSLALAGAWAGLGVTIYAPRTNSPEKNAAMAGFGAKLVLFGDDFDAARVEAARVAALEGLHWVPAFHRNLALGVATYGLELFTAHPDLEVVYVPVGCGSGICAMITVRDLLGLKTEIVGVVAEGADYAARSFEAGRPVATEAAHTFADGMAVRAPVETAWETILKGAARIVRVSDEAIAEAIRVLWTDTHNAAEGAGAAPLAALALEKVQLQGKKAGVILCGGNIDRAVLAEVLAGETPKPF